MDTSPSQRARENLTGIVSVLVTGTWLVALLTGQSWWLPFMLFGYIVLVPVTAMLFGDEEDIEEWWDDDVDPTESSETTEQEESNEGSALETIRERYARGELTDEQFERKLERLLETETLEDVEQRHRDTQAVEKPRSPDRATERETELE